jgi:hypothetical protein
MVSSFKVTGVDLNPNSSLNKKIEKFVKEQQAAI